MAAPEASRPRKKPSAQRGDGALPPPKAAAAAARQLRDLTGRQPEGIVGLERTDDGWRVRVEVVEVRRIPETTDVLAVYEVDVDRRGDLTGYHRLRRFGRAEHAEE